MKIFVYCLGLGLFAGCFLVFGGRAGVVKPAAKPFARLYAEQSDVKPWQGKSPGCLLLALALILAGLQAEMLRSADVYTALGLSGLYSITATAAVIDWKRKIIPNQLVLAGCVLRAVLWALQLPQGGEGLAFLVSEIVGGVFGFGLIALAAALTKGGIGLGDAKLMGVVGLLAGFTGAFSTLLAALVISVAVSLYGILIKHWNRRQSIPFGPCIAAGYCAAIMLQSY